MTRLHFASLNGSSCSGLTYDANTIDVHFALIFVLRSERSRNRIGKVYGLDELPFASDGISSSVDMFGNIQPRSAKQRDRPVFRRDSL